MADKGHYRPWHPVVVGKDNSPPRDNREIRKCDAAAIQALAAGIASEGQQKMAYAAILHICGLNDMAWMPDEHGGERETCFASGKQFVGRQILKINSFSLSVLTGEDNDDREPHDRRTGKPADDRNSRRARQ